MERDEEVEKLIVMSDEDCNWLIMELSFSNDKDRDTKNDRDRRNRIIDTLVNYKAPHESGLVRSKNNG